MSSVYRFRLANTLSGLFVLATLAAVVGAFIYAGMGKGWFESHFNVNGVISGQVGALGVRPGTEIRVSDRPIGAVTGVELLWSGNIGVEMKIGEKYRTYLSQDQDLIVRKPYGLFGDAFLDVQAKQEDDRAYEDEQVMRIRKDGAAMDKVSEAIAEIREVALPMVEKLEKIEGHIANIAEDIDSGKGTLGTLISDEQMAADVRATVSNLNRTASGLPEIAERVEAVATKADTMADELARASVTIGDAAERFDKVGSNGVRITEDLKETSAVLRRESQDLRGMVAHARETLHEIDRLTKGMQRHWLVRKNIEHPPEESGPGAADAVVLRRELQTVPGAGVAFEAARDELEHVLAQYKLACSKSEMANLGHAVADNALAVAVCSYALGRPPECEAALAQAMLEGEDSHVRGDAALVKWLLMKDDERGDPWKVARAEDATDATASFAHVLAAQRALKIGDVDEAIQSLDRAEALEKRAQVVNPASKSERIRTMAQVNRVNGKWSEAAARLERSAGILQSAGRYRAMALSLAEAGEAWLKGDRAERAARAYVAAARTLLRSGDLPGASVYIRAAAKAGEGLAVPELDATIRMLDSEIQDGLSGGS